MSWTKGDGTWNCFIFFLRLARQRNNGINISYSILNNKQFETKVKLLEITSIFD